MNSNKFIMLGNVIVDYHDINRLRVYQENTDNAIWYFYFKTQDYISFNLKETPNNKEMFQNDYVELCNYLLYNEPLTKNKYFQHE